MSVNAYLNDIIHQIYKIFLHIPIYNHSLLLLLYCYDSNIATSASTSTSTFSDEDSSF
jgi:hypothetical protein